MVIQRHWRNQQKHQPGALGVSMACGAAQCAVAWHGQVSTQLNQHRSPVSCRLPAAGIAREHLHKWIAAASVVQRAARAWMLRRGLERFAAHRRRREAGVAQLQALWRARGPFRRYQALRQAAITFQVLGSPCTAVLPAKFSKLPELLKLGTLWLPPRLPPPAAATSCRPLLH